MIEKQIIKRIIKLHEAKQPIIVAIAGAADLGKTYLSKKIVHQLNKQHISSGHLPLDGYLLDRKQRKEKGLSGYQIEAHNMELIQKDLAHWLKNRTISYRPYGHKSGQKAQLYKRLTSTEVLLIEGLFSMDQRLLPYIDYTIFIYTSDKNLKKIKCEADITKRDYTKAYSEKIYDYEFGLYQANIEPFKHLAACKIMLKDKWNYTLEEKNNKT